MSPGRRVFVVDDEAPLAESLQAILAGAGYAAESFTTARKCLEAVKKDPPALVITDVVMPMMDGVELALAIAAEAPQTKVILFSGQASTTAMVENAKKLGYDFEVMPKPLHPGDVLQRLGVLLGG